MNKHIVCKEGTTTTPAHLKPEWIRPKDAILLFSIGRTKLYELISDGRIKSVSLRERGQKHGTRLISFDSLASYLERLAEH